MREGSDQEDNGCQAESVSNGNFLTLRGKGALRIQCPGESGSDVG